MPRTSPWVPFIKPSLIGTYAACEHCQTGNRTQPNPVVRLATQVAVGAPPRWSGLGAQLGESSHLRVHLEGHVTLPLKTPSYQSLSHILSVFCIIVVIPNHVLTLRMKLLLLLTDQSFPGGRHTSFLLSLLLLLLLLIIIIMFDTKPREPVTWAPCLSDKICHLCCKRTWGEGGERGG